MMNLDGTLAKSLTGPDQLAGGGRLSPDGKRILYTTFTLAKKEPPAPVKRVLTVLDIDSGKSLPVADVPLNAEIIGYCWSPDGKKIAYTWRSIPEGKAEDSSEAILIVCDPDGKNQKTIASDTATGPWRNHVGHVDWR